MEITTLQKRCSRCKEIKDAQLMVKSSKSKDGLSSWCRACSSVYNKRYKRPPSPDSIPKRSPRGTGRAMYLALRNTCKNCGNEFGPRITPCGQIINPKNRRYCSAKCFYMAKRTGRSKYINVCATCLQSFETYTKKQKYCSKVCLANKPATKEMTHRKRAWRAVKAESCAICGITGRLHHHHRDRDITNNNPSNIMILCPKCHRAEHKRMEDRFGRKRRITRAHTNLLSNMSLNDRRVAEIIGVSTTTVWKNRIALGLKKVKNKPCVTI